MTSFLLDTSVIIEIMGNRPTSSKIKEYVSDFSFSLSPITVYEITKAKNLKPAVFDFLRRSTIEQFGFSTANLCGVIFKKLQEGGKLINELDILIAANAIENNLVLITFDKDFERIAEVFPTFEVKIFNH